MLTSWLAYPSAALDGIAPALRGGAMSVALLVAATAHAQPTDGRIRLGFDFSFLGLEVRTTEIDDGPSQDMVTVSSGFAFDDTFINAGYGASELLTLGMRLRSGSIATAFTDQDETPTQTSYNLTALPYLEVNLSDDGVFRPLIGPTLGVDLTVLEARSDSGSDPDFQSVDATFLFGAFFGARIFVTETFAVEPTLVATYGVGAYTSESAGASDVDGSSKAFTLMLLFGGSAWLGGNSGKAPAPSESTTAPEAYEPAPYPAPAPEPAPSAAPLPPPPAQPAPGEAPPATSPASPAPEQVPAPPPAPSTP